MQLSWLVLRCNVCRLPAGWTGRTMHRQVLRVVCGLLSLRRLHSRVALFGRCCCLLPVFVCVWCAIVRGIRGLHLCSYCFALRRWCASNQFNSVMSLGRCSGWFVVVTHLPWAVKSRRSACESWTAWCCWYFSHARSTSLSIGQFFV